MKFMSRLSLLLLCVFCVTGYAQDELIEAAKERAVAFALEAEFALPEYHMVVDIDAESSPESTLLFTSKSSMEVFQTKTIQFESFASEPKILSDARDGAINAKGGVLDYGPFARRERWERLIVDGKTFDLLDDDFKKVKGSEPAHPVSLNASTFCVNPFDWPLLGPGGFDGRKKEQELFKYTFGRDRVCVAAEKNGPELLDSHWTLVSSKVTAIQRVTFKEDLPVCSEIYLLRKESDPKGYDLKSAMKIIRTDTAWQEFGDTFVPKTVVLKIIGVGGNRSGQLIKAKMQFFRDGDRIFEKRKQDLAERGVLKLPASGNP